MHRLFTYNKRFVIFFLHFARNVNVNDRLTYAGVIVQSYFTEIRQAAVRTTVVLRFRDHRWKQIFISEWNVTEWRRVQVGAMLRRRLQIGTMLRRRVQIGAMLRRRCGGFCDVRYRRRLWRWSKGGHADQVGSLTHDIQGRLQHSRGRVHSLVLFLFHLKTLYVEIIRYVLFQCCFLSFLLSS